MKLFTKQPALSGCDKQLSNPSSQLPILLTLLLSLSFFMAPAQLFQGSAPTVAGIQPVIDAYRAALGPLNANVAGSFGTGRREINWDGVPDALSAPNFLPPNFFNSNSPRGVVFSTPGAGFQVSANAATGPIQFANINLQYPTLFETFSPQRLFTSIGANVCDIQFFVPGTTTPALTKGFGAVFTDVDIAGATQIQYFDANNTMLLNVPVPTFPGNESFSFTGFIFPSPVVARVRIIAGNAPLGVPIEPIADLVVEDDFIYGEPVPLVVSTDLSITKTVNRSTASTGDNLTYTIVVNNTGLNAAQNVQVSDMLPAGTAIQSVIATGSFAVSINSATNSFTATTTTLPANASGTFTVAAAVTASAAGTLSNTATVTSSTTDPNTANNSATAVTSVCTSINVSIPDAMALPSGVEPNTVYPGYAPASSITLTAMASGGAAPYNFTWSNGSHTESITVSPTTTTTYTVAVTDNSGCPGGTASKTVYVADVSGGHQLDKVMICHKGKNTLTISAEDVDDHLAHGDKLGACTTPSATTRAIIPGQKEMIAPDRFDLAIYPNPLGIQTQIRYAVPVKAKVTIRIFDVLGKEVDVLFNGNLESGIYTSDYNASRLGSGLYYCTMVATSDGKQFVQTQKLLKQ